MTHSVSAARQQAEIAFAKAQSQSHARNREVQELDAVTQAREEKTLRLREARLARELEDRKTRDAAAVARRDVTA